MLNLLQDVLTLVSHTFAQLSVDVVSVIFEINEEWRKKFTESVRK
jgi:hypothetical protein